LKVKQFLQFEHKFPLANVYQESYSSFTWMVSFWKFCFILIKHSLFLKYRLNLYYSLFLFYPVLSFSFSFTFIKILFKHPDHYLHYKLRSMKVCQFNLSVLKWSYPASLPSGDLKIFNLFAIALSILMFFA